jgi:lambda repressor-like predicted transcriptional regulator
MGVLVSGLHEEPYQRFIKLLSSAHRESGLSLRELSDRSAIPGATLVSILRGRSFPPGLRVVHTLIKALGVSPPREKAILEAYDRAVNSSSSFVSGDHRTGSAVISAVTQEHQANATMIRGERAPYFINGAGEKAEADSTGPPPLIADVDGYDGRPNPLTAATKAEFVAALRAFWQWAGAPSARKLEVWSGRAFSHSTVNELLAEAPCKRPPMKLPYVQGVIRGCGGDEKEIQRWSTAWRQIYQGAKKSAGAEGKVIPLNAKAAPHSG